MKQILWSEIEHISEHCPWDCGCHRHSQVKVSMVKLSECVGAYPLFPHWVWMRALLKDNDAKLIFHALSCCKKVIKLNSMRLAPSIWACHMKVKTQKYQHYLSSAERQRNIKCCLQTNCKESMTCLLFCLPNAYIAGALWNTTGSGRTSSLCRTCTQCFTVY